jgi:DNA polymerase elongation subunit (family B)
MPEKKPLLAELFLEKIFFKHAFAFNKPPAPSTEKGEGRKWFKFYDEVVELDFSFVWPTLFTYPFHNLGFDSLNCACCQPSGLEAKNLSPGSRVEVEFQASGIYIFNPVDPDWAAEMHGRLPGKEQRLAKQKEWSLASPPIGPFDRQTKLFLPLKDALDLVDQGSARLTGEKQVAWFCQKKESFLSKEIEGLNQEINLVGRSLDAFEQKALQEFGLLSDRALADDLNYYFTSRYKEKVGELLTFIPTHLFSSKSKFHSPELSRSIKALQKQTLDAFKHFTLEEGGKFVHADRGRAFVKSASGLSLVKKFSQEKLIPVPKVKGKRSGVFWR